MEGFQLSQVKNVATPIHLKIGLSGWSRVRENTLAEKFF